MVTHIKPVVGTERCQVRHVGVVLSGRIGVELADASSLEAARNRLRHPLGHDGWTIGDEQAVAIE